MLLGDVLPRWDVRQRHAARVGATPERVYEAVRRLDMARSPLSRVLFAARGMRSGGRITFSDLLARGFVLLGEDPPRELVLGLIARPWTPLGGVQRLDADGFRRFDLPGYARIGWNFLVEPGDAGSRLVTETRVLCTDARSRRRFRMYWRLAGPFSGMIRREALAIIRADAEA